MVVYMGLFDFILLGYLNVIECGSWMFVKFVVGIGMNIEKNFLFSLDEWFELVLVVILCFVNVEVVIFEGLVVDFVNVKCF